MAILEIVTTAGEAMEYSFSRGNGGVLSDIRGGLLNEFSLPTLGGVCDYPVVGNVRLGVVYGAGTGNVVLPATTNVLTGVGYGSNGTEYTGNATAGGGETSHVF